MILDDTEVITRTCRYKEDLLGRGITRQFFTLDLVRDDPDRGDGLRVHLHALGVSVTEAVDLFFMGVAGFTADEGAVAFDAGYVENNNPDTGRPWTDDEVDTVDPTSPDGALLKQGLAVLVARRGCAEVLHYLCPYEIDDDTHAVAWDDVLEHDGPDHVFVPLAEAFDYEDLPVALPRMAAYPQHRRDELVMRSFAEMGFFVILTNRDGVRIAAPV